MKSPVSCWDRTKTEKMGCRACIWCGKLHSAVQLKPPISSHHPGPLWGTPDGDQNGLSRPDGGVAALPSLLSQRKDRSWAAGRAAGLAAPDPLHSWVLLSKKHPFIILSWTRFWIKIFWTFMSNLKISRTPCRSAVRMTWQGKRWWCPRRRWENWARWWSGTWRARRCWYS